MYLKEMTKNIKMQITNGDAQMWGAIVDDLIFLAKNVTLLFLLLSDL